MRQISSGPDGIAYAGIDDSDQSEVLVARVFLARRDPERWRQVCQRIALSTHVKHASVLRARAWQPAGRDPYLVTTLRRRTLTTLVGTTDRAQSVEIAIRLAVALSEVHQLGFAHGRLCPSRIGVDEMGNPELDIFGLRLGDPALSEHDVACLEGNDDRTHPQVADVFGLGMLCVRLLTSREIESPIGHGATHNAVTQVADAGSRLSLLLHEMVSPVAGERPSMHEVVARLQRTDVSQLFTTVSGGLGDGSDHTGKDAASQAPNAGSTSPGGTTQDLQSGTRIGRYDLGRLLGEGGMGKVFQATDIATGRVVALKVLHAHWSRDEEALARFYREARLLSRLSSNPNIANFIDANEVDGIHYLAMDFVAGNSLHEVLKEETRLDADLALSLTRDVALALADVHDLGIIHRDIKPANILLIGTGDARRATLCDFGIAREVATDQELTRAGLTVGTPHYMAPEQCVGGDVTPASDIYALGITLFKMLAGYVPFNAKDAQAIVFKHLAEPVPEIRSIAPDVTESAARVLRRMLEKVPDVRIADARLLLEELEPARTGNKTTMASHPKIPGGSQDVITYDFEWPLRAAPSALWPHVSHTERLNRAIGLGAVEFTRELDAHGNVRTFGKLKMSGLTLDWREHAYEWVAPSRMGVLREFSAGPFIWLRSAVELVARGGGTLLRHQIQVQPRGMLGKAAAAVEVGFKARRNLERVYRRIDERVAKEGTASSDPGRSTHTEPPGADAFEDATRLGRPVEHRIATIESELSDIVSPAVAQQLCHFVRNAPAQDVARIRPRAFARRHQLDDCAVLRACMHGARLGLLVMLWDIICPSCRIPSNIVESLKALREHDHCEACNLDFKLDFGRSVEIIFRADPALRESELGTFCIGGPGHTPHVLMQIRIQPGERFEVDLMLEEGDYTIAGRHLPTTWPFTVRRGEALHRWEIALGGPSQESPPRESRHDHARPHAPQSHTPQNHPAQSHTPQNHPAQPNSTPGPITPFDERLAAIQRRVLDAGHQRIVLHNESSGEVVARIERDDVRADAVTAAEVAATAAFRELFPSEVLSPGHLISIGRVTLLVAQADVWREDDDANAFAQLTQLTRVVTQSVEKAGGAIVKIHGNGIMAAFPSPKEALRAAFALIDDRMKDLRVAVHTGPAMATSINDRLDYFGRIVQELEKLLETSAKGTATISEATYADPDVAQLLEQLPPPVHLVTVHEMVGQVFDPTHVASQGSPPQTNARSHDNPPQQPELATGPS